jgi:hypothetical protein
MAEEKGAVVTGSSPVVTGGSQRRSQEGGKGDLKESADDL